VPTRRAVDRVDTAHALSRVCAFAHLVRTLLTQ